MIRRRRLAELIELLQREPRLRQRVAALGGVSIFFAGALIAVGLGLVVLVAIGIAAFGAVLVVVPRQRLSSRGPRRWPAASAVLPPTEEDLAGWPYAGSEEPHDDKARVDEERRRALELNARGSQMRRDGSPAAAAALHLEAVAIFQSLDDRRGQALTLNSLALALAANGETPAAVERFEQSLSILRERPEDPGQAEVTANLGFTLLQAGSDDRACELLRKALETLPPDSPAAHRVEAGLRRAS